MKNKLCSEVSGLYSKESESRKKSVLTAWGQYLRHCIKEKLGGGTQRNDLEWEINCALKSLSYIPKKRLNRQRLHCDGI